WPNSTEQVLTASYKGYRIAFSGEIYNKEDWMNIAGSNDVERIINGFVSEGARILNRMNGQFILAIYDEEEKNLFLARDRFGIKSMYYTIQGDELIFATDIPAILGELKDKPTANDAVIFDYLVFNRTDQTENTFFTGIKKLMHGCYLTADSLGIKVSKWYNLSQAVKDVYYSTNKEEYLKRFENAVQLRLQGDKPWGVCLSGGLDSSAVTSTIIKRLNQKDVHSFSAVYGKGCKSDESKYIDQFADMVPNMHYVYPTADKLYDVLDKLIQIQAEPTPTTSPFALYCVMEEVVKQGKQVTLDGQGSDEALAGYEYIPGLYYKTLFTHFRWFSFIKENIKYLKVHHSTRSLKYCLFFMLPAKMRMKARVAQRGYINPTFVERFHNSVIADKLYGANTMQEMLINHFEYKLEHLLKWGDNNANYFGLISRVPFLDHNIVEYSIALEDKAKVHNGYTKYILREAMCGIMPEDVRKRVDKMGFSVPQDEWFREEKFQKLIMDILTSDSFRNRGYIIPEEAVALYQRHLRGEVNVSKDIWKWINLELWFRMFIDK
ncbi:MAG: asparagine synthase (glutamine-hydrolyzing), partial [Prevotellaceae bacterium]|nr:asparagine synthase (glutamine-hydrolyzing) [Candidatus Faecinaster equi]